MRTPGPWLWFLPGMLALTCFAPLHAAQPSATTEAFAVTATVRLVDRDGPRAVLAARFVPEPNPGHPWHLYSMDLPVDGIDGIGRPTRLDLPDASPLAATGELTADAEPQKLVQEGFDRPFPVYPAGPLTLRLPVRLPAGDGAPVTVTVLVTYMACNDRTCNVPVEREPVRLQVPTHPDGVVGNTAATPPDQQPTADPPASVTAGLRWRSVGTRSEIEAVLGLAATAKRPVLLDFTGPSCSSCQHLIKSVFPLPTVREALEDLELVEIDTDRHFHLARWQQETFGTSTRPLLVRIDPDGERTTWAGKPDGDAEGLGAFVAFLRGGAGNSTEAGKESWWRFLVLAVLGGLFTLVMPCTYPMIPFTVNYFARQAGLGRSLLPLAGLYSLGIVVFFVLIGLVVSVAFGLAPASIGGHWVAQLGIGLLFLALGLSLLDVFFLRLPASVTARLGGGNTGYIGALAMGATFALIAFTCTAPFAGFVLAQAAITGQWYAAAVGMAVYASVIAVPFFLLAVTPGLLHRLPDAGAWMNEFKVVGGLVMLAVALRYQGVADTAWELGLIRRDPVLALWAALAGLTGAYLLGWLRTRSDAALTGIGPLRLLVAAAAFALAIHLASGLAGNHLGLIEALFPADAPPPLT